MRVLLVRHARAGDRGEWVGDDAHRPLDAKGRKQAKRLAKRLDGSGRRDRPGDLPAPGLNGRKREAVEQLQHDPFAQAAAADLERDAEEGWSAATMAVPAGSARARQRSMP